MTKSACTPTLSDLGHRDSHGKKKQLGFYKNLFGENWLIGTFLSTEK